MDARYVHLYSWNVEVGPCNAIANSTLDPRDLHEYAGEADPNYPFIDEKRGTFELLCSGLGLTNVTC